MKKYVEWALDRFGVRLVSNQDVNLFDAVIRKLNRPGFTFIQIGANDGRRFDPIYRYAHRYRWTGLVVEPIQEYYQELCRNYAGVRSVTCCNYAICEQAGPVVMHRIDPRARDLPEWTKGIASIDRDHHRKSKTPDEVIVPEEVQGITLSTLLDMHTISDFDLIVIDTEGYDYRIVKMVDFSRFSPKVVQFEHCLHEKVMPMPQLMELVRLLIGHGYDIHIGRYDCLAYRMG